MANQEHQCCSCDNHVKVETLTLDDGRKAERHTSVDANGNEVVETFAEEKRPLKLEKRIVREFKNVVAKETHQSIRDGEVSMVEVKSLEPEQPLQVRERLGLADHATLVNGDYVRRDDLQALISEGVVAGVSALMDNMEPVVAQSFHPVVSAQSIVEQNVDEKKKQNLMFNVTMAVILVAQAAFFGYIFFVM